MSQRWRLKFKDNTRNPVTGNVESSTMSGSSAQVTDLTYGAQQALHNAFVTSVTALSLGLLVEDEFAGFTTSTSPPIPATDPNAQRERKWLVKGYRNNGALDYPAFSMQIPCADIADLLPNTEQLDPTAATYTNLKTNLEAYVLVNGDSVIVTGVYLVGRNI